VVVIGLTGGIGSGKSTVAALLAERGAHAIDADRIAREVVEPGRPALVQIVERFGDGVLQSDGSLDRAALAAVAFADDQARKDLNAITHPAIGVELLSQLAAAQAADPDGVAILDIPLLAEGGRDRYALDAVIVVDAPVEVAVHRLVERRGFAEEDARARVSSQATREERRAIADVVIDNSGTPDALPPQVEAAWQWITGELCHRGS
jgi:dephospho-CoA kinase